MLGNHCTERKLWASLKHNQHQLPVCLRKFEHDYVYIMFHESSFHVA